MWDEGPVDVEPGLTIDLYGGDGTTETPVTTYTTTDILPGEGSLEFTLTLEHAVIGTICGCGRPGRRRAGV